MKAKLTLSIDAALIDTIKEKNKFGKNINLSKMVEQFLMSEFNFPAKEKKSVVKGMRGILKGAEDPGDWKKIHHERLEKKYL